MASPDDEVMVIEDEPEARAYLVKILELEGFKVVAFGNGADALAALKSQPDLPCLIVLDMRMPIMDGPRFRAAVLADSRLSAIPVVVVTGFDPSAAAKLSAIRIFRKPIDIDAFLGTVRENC
jgi:CheY-like chemotaxis protein